MKYAKLVEKIHENVLSARRLEYLVTSTEFVAAFSKIQNDDKALKELEEAVKDSNIHVILRIMRKTEHWTLLPIDDLRKYASSQGIKYASDYTKEELLGLLHE